MKKVLSFLAIAMIMMGLGACSGGGGASTPEGAVNSYLKAMKDGDAKAMMEASCDYHGNPVEYSEEDEKEIKEAEAFLAMFSDMEYTVDNVVVSDNDKKAEVDVSIKLLGEENSKTFVCIKGDDGKWRVYNN